MVVSSVSPILTWRRGSYLYQVTGDLKYADQVQPIFIFGRRVCIQLSIQVERMAYNALPATLTGGKEYGSCLLALSTFAC